MEERKRKRRGRRKERNGERKKKERGGKKLNIRKSRDKIKIK